MSKVRGPLYSISAHGTIGKSMIHQSLKGIPTVKKYRKPTQPNSAAQLTKRNIMKDAVSRWQNFTASMKGFWVTVLALTGKKMSGYNFFLSQYLIDVAAGLWPSDYPPDRWWTDDTSWTERAPQFNGQITIYCLAVFNGKLYGGASSGGRLFEWNGIDAWIQKAPELNSQTIIYSLAVFNGKLYAGTYPNGRLFEWNGVDAWVQKADQLLGEKYLYSLCIYMNNLYSSSGDSGMLFEWNGVDAWILKAPQLDGEKYIYWLTVFQNKLYAGTSTHGKLFEWSKNL